MTFPNLIPKEEEKRGGRRGLIKQKDILSRLKDKTQNKVTDTYFMRSPKKLQRGGDDQEHYDEA